MKKRAALVMIMLIVLFLATGIRIYGLIMNSVDAAGASSSKTVDVARLRGTVYDCNFNRLTDSEYELYAAALPSNEALAGLKGKVLPQILEEIIGKMSKGNPVAVKLDKPVAESDALLSEKIPKRYSASRIACHIIGCTDSQGNGVSGAEKAYNGILSENNKTVSFRFSANALGKAMLGEGIEITGNEICRNGVVLTLDKEIQSITESVLDASQMQCAAAVLIEIESGAVRACVSRPDFDQSNVAASLSDERSPLINRAFLPFSVGSVFKPVVAAAALENGISENYEYNCTGSVTLNGITFHCHKEDGHGLLNMEQAVACSCNTYFISLALKTGNSGLIETASRFGFGESTFFAEGMEASSGNLPAVQELDSFAATANLSFGQGSLLATPVQICSMMSTIARGGVRITPYLIEGECDENGKFTAYKNYSEQKRIISEENAEKLKYFLECVVEYGSGKRAKSNTVAIAGKTATAQTGKTENGNEIYNAWFAGYFPADKPQYALVIMKENGGEGAVSCAPVFKEIAQKLLNHNVGNTADNNGLSNAE